MVKSSDIKEFYEKYMKNIEREEKIQQELKNFDVSKEEWIIKLRDNSIERRKTYLENENLIYSLIVPFLEDREQFSEELGDTILKYMDLLMRKDVDNINVTIKLMDKLIEYYNEQGNLSNYIKACYYKSFFQQKCGGINDYCTSYQYLSNITKYNDKFDTFDDEVREMMIYAYLNRVYCASLSIRKESDNQIAIDALEEAISFYERDDVRTLVEEFDFERMLIRAKRVFISAVNDLFFDNEEHISESRTYIAKAFDVATELFDYETFVNGDNISIQLVADYTYLKYLIGLYGKHEFFNEIYTFYIKKRRVALSSPGMVKSLVLNVAPLVVKFAQWSDMTEQGKKEVRFDILNDLCEVYANHEIKSQNYYVNNKVWKILDSVLRSASETEFVKHCVLDVTVMSEPQSAIHALMVKKIATVIAEKLIEQKSRVFVDYENYNSPEEVYANKGEIIKFVSDCALIHDIGKCLCFEKVNNYFRKITLDEFEVIKRHPRDGADLLDKVPVLSKYKNVCYCHHKYYNGKGGYPKGVDNTSIKDKIYVDLITVADTIDSATDNIGRSYNASKSLKTVLMELREGKGTKYNSDIVETIEENRELFEELKRITSREREDVYYQIYKKFI